MNEETLDKRLADIAYEWWSEDESEDGYLVIAQLIKNAVIDALVAEAEAMNPHEDFTILDSDAWQVMAWLRSHKTDE